MVLADSFLTGGLPLELFQIFYPGGCFLPGGKRAPAGGQYVPLSEMKPRKIPSLGTICKNLDESFRPYRDFDKKREKRRVPVHKFDAVFSLYKTCCEALPQYDEPNAQGNNATLGFFDRVALRMYTMESSISNFLGPQTRSFYYLINYFLRRRDMRLPKGVRDFAEYVIRAIKRNCNTFVKVYRGLVVSNENAMSENEKAFHEAIQQKDANVAHNSFTSTSTCEATARDTFIIDRIMSNVDGEWVVKQNVNVSTIRIVLFTISKVEGLSLRNISAFAQENEVLVAPTYLRVRTTEITTFREFCADRVVPDCVAELSVRLVALEPGSYPSEVCKHSWNRPRSTTKMSDLVSSFSSN